MVLIVVDTSAAKQTYALPKAFRPGSDVAINSFFKPQPQGSIKQILEFKIYNRYGNLVYSTNDILSDGWDGTYQGHIEPVDTYIYTITVETNDGKISTKKGSVLLLR
jgi:gliding motility-associated-like protein